MRKILLSEIEIWNVSNERTLPWLPWLPNIDTYNNATQTDGPLMSHGKHKFIVMK